MIKNQLILAFSGHIGSGKDTAAMISAKILFEKFGQVCTEKHAFADGVRECVQLMTGYKMSVEHFEFYSNIIYTYNQTQKNIYLKEWGMTVGQMLQKLGTDAIRDNFHRDAWILTLNSKLRNTSNHVVITDLRFPNEAESLKNTNAVLIRLEGDPARIREQSNRDLTHASEISLDDYNGFDYVIKTTPNINDLEYSLKNIICKHI